MMTRTQAIRRATLLVPVFLGATTGFLFATRPPITRLPPRTITTAAPLVANAEHLPSGAKATLDADIVLDAIQRDASGREALEFHADIQEDAAEDVKVTYVASLADDADRIVHTAKPSAQMAVAPGSKKSSIHHVTPRLADGFYSLALTVAALGKKVEDSSTVRRFLEVKGGQINEITIDDWHRRSNVRAGIYVGSSDPVDPPTTGPKRGAP